MTPSTSVDVTGVGVEYAAAWTCRSSADGVDTHEGGEYSVDLHCVLYADNVQGYARFAQIAAILMQHVRECPKFRKNMNARAFF